jgi:hypothetical protein
MSKNMIQEGRLFGTQIACENRYRNRTGNIRSYHRSRLLI